MTDDLFDYALQRDYGTESAHEDLGNGIPEKRSIEERFLEFKESDFGKWVISEFIREAYRWYVLEKHRVGQRFIWERLRWILLTKEFSGCLKAPPDPDSNGEYFLNDHFTKHVAMYAVEKEPKLEGCFEFRTKGAA